MLNRKNKKKSKKNKEVVYLVYTDVVGSSKLDRDPKKVIMWRKNTFFKQLNSLLNPEKSLVLKSIGDALFVLYDGVNRSDEKSAVRKILCCVYEAFEKNKKTPIRATVHRITGHKRGKRIKDHLEKRLKKQDNMKCLTDSLEKDIFGLEVNRVSRIISLVHAPAILVSEDIANQLDQKANEKAIEGRSIDVGIKYNNKNDLILHSPVPVLLMKGIYKCDTRKKPHYNIWELGLNDEDPILACEFKTNQSLRLITAELKRRNFPDDENKGKTPRTEENLTKEILNKLGLDDPDNKLRFYVDILWKISDYFVMQDPLFNRKSRQDANDIFKFLENLIPKKLKNEEANDKKIRLKGQTGVLNITVDTGNIKVEHLPDPEVSEEFGIFLLAFTSFPDNDHMALTRKYLSKENVAGKLVSTIEPQSTAIYSTIITTKSFIEKLNEDKASTIFTNFGEKKYILFMFQIYFNSLADADDINKLFNGITVIEGDDLKVEFYGLTPGLIDGFVLYSSYIKDQKEILQIILDKFFSAGRKDNIFYGKVYPFAVFILEAEKKFLPLKRNICYLRRLSQNDKLKKTFKDIS